MNKCSLFLALVFSFNVHAGKYDHLLNGNASADDLCAALLNLMGGRGADLRRAPEPELPPQLDAVMDYFIAGIYLNALWIEKRGLGSSIEASIIDRAHEELSETKFTLMSSELDGAIAMSRPSTEEYYVWRGQAPNVPPPANGKMYKPGEIIRFAQYLSTSDSEYLGESYAKGVLLKILVPRGARALNVQKLLRMEGGQNELLFARDSALLIEKVSMRGAHTLVEAKLLYGQ